MLVYVSGPITGQLSGFERHHRRVRANINRAASVARELWLKGHAVICPHLNTDFEGNEAVSHAAFLAGDLNMVARCDALVMLPDWETSRGARVEHEYAASLGIPIYIAPDLPPLHPTETRCPAQAQAFREVVGQLYRVHLDKNADYSPMNILLTGELGLLTRLWDKTARLLSLGGFRTKRADIEAVYEAPREPKNESVEDSYRDLAVYSIIGLLLRRGAWGR